MADIAAYTARINATNYALSNDDGTGGDYAHADVILVGVSRSGKLPRVLYMALQYGVFAANYPLTEEDLEAGHLPRRLEPHRRKLFALSIKPETAATKYATSGAPTAGIRPASSAIRASGRRRAVYTLRNTMS